MPFEQFDLPFVTHLLENLSVSAYCLSGPRYKDLPVNESEEQIRPLGLHPAQFHEPTITISLSRIEFVSTKSQQW
jgi:hypothetical protein